MSKKTKQSSTQSSTDRVATWVQITIAFITFSGLIFTIGAFVLNAIFTQISRLDERMQTLEGRIFDIARSEGVVLNPENIYPNDSSIGTDYSVPDLPVRIAPSIALQENLGFAALRLEIPSPAYNFEDGNISVGSDSDGNDLKLTDLANRQFCTNFKR